MAKIKVGPEGIEQEVRPDREARWNDYIENYKKQNPVKYALKRATEYVDPITGKKVAKEDEFASIPPSFK